MEISQTGSPLGEQARAGTTGTGTIDRSEKPLKSVFGVGEGSLLLVLSGYVFQKNDLNAVETTFPVLEIEAFFVNPSLQFSFRERNFVYIAVGAVLYRIQYV
jgi:hypothetical protein